MKEKRIESQRDIILNDLNFEAEKDRQRSLINLFPNMQHSFAGVTWFCDKYKNSGFGAKPLAVERL